MLGVGGGEHGVSKLHVRKFVCGEFADFSSRVEILADYENGSRDNDASNGVNCLGVNGVELASQKCRVNDYHNFLYYYCYLLKLSPSMVAALQKVSHRVSFVKSPRSIFSMTALAAGLIFLSTSERART